jgi:hypothetical protein
MADTPSARTHPENGGLAQQRAPDSSCFARGYLGADAFAGPAFGHIQLVGLLKVQAAAGTAPEVTERRSAVAAVTARSPARIVVIRDRAPTLLGGFAPTPRVGVRP